MLEIISGELTTVGHGLAEAGEVLGTSDLAGEVAWGGRAMPGGGSPSVLKQAGTELEHEANRITRLLQQAGQDAVSAERMFMATDEEHER